MAQKYVLVILAELILIEIKSLEDKLPVVNTHSVYLATATTFKGESFASDKTVVKLIVL
jgi:hypothetical protein